MNSMFKKSLAIIAVATAALGTSSAHALPTFKVVGIGTLSNMVTEPAPAIAPTGKLAVGAGALVTFPMAGVFALETGALYAPRKVDFAGLMTISTTMLEVPVMARFNLIPFLSLGAGLSYAQGIGKIKYDVLGVATEKTADEAGVKSGNLGAVASVSLDLPFLPGTGFVVDGRYRMQLSNSVSDATKAGSTSLKQNDLMIMAGVRIGMGK